MTAVTDPETLRKVAEEVRSAFPRALGGPELVLIDVDPRHVHAFWSVSPSVVEATRAELGAEGADAPMVLRLHEVTAGGGSAGAFDVEVVGLQGHCYVDIWGEARRYRGELGLRRAGGRIAPLAVSGVIELPRSGPAGADAAAEPIMESLPQAQVAGQTTSPIAPTAEPVRHPFPLPPSEPSAFDAAGLMPTVATAGVHALPAVGPAGTQPARVHVPGPEIVDLPEPVRHPFPLPPTESSEFEPRALIGGFLTPSAEPSSESAATPGEAEAIHHPERSEHPAAGEEPAGGAAAEPEDAPQLPLPLENVLTLSSYALGRENVEFEVNAKLHIFGRARPGTQLQLFGRKVPLLPDGTFSVTRPLPNGALVLSSLLVGDDGLSDES